jgi:hypothetical protein
LPPGEHEIHFKSSLTNPTTGILFFADEVKYHLNVVEAAESPSNSTSGQSTDVMLLKGDQHLNKTHTRKHGTGDAAGVLVELEIELL